MSVAANPNIVTSGLVLSMDAGNPRSYSPNTFPSPIDTFGYFGTAGTNNCTISRDTSIAPSPANGIPLKMAVTGNDPYIATYASTNWSFTTAAPGQTWTVSVWIRASAATTAGFFIFGANSAGGYIELVNPMFSVTTEWQRFSGSITLGNPSTTALQVRFDGPDSGGTGVNVWYDGLQVEQTSTASNFNSRYNLNGITYDDLSLNRYNGVLTNGPTYKSQNNGYIDFDGVNDYSLSSGLQTFGNDMTWEAWVYCTQNVSTYNMFMGRYLPYFSFYGGVQLYFSNNIGGVQQTIATAGNLSLNTWYHGVFTVSYSAPNTTMKIYTNGVETASQAFSGTQQNYAYGFMIGDGNNGSNSSWYPFKGRIGPVKVYNRTLSATEVQQNFNALRGRYGI